MMWIIQRLPSKGETVAGNFRKQENKRVQCQNMVRHLVHPLWKATSQEFKVWIAPIEI